MRFVRRNLVIPESPHPGGPRVDWVALGRAWGDWVASTGVQDGLPYLLDPEFRFDTQLNGFFSSPGMLTAAWNTQAAYARDLAGFLTFLWAARDKRDFRLATADDHLAYLVWRRKDEQGPHIAASTWDREVASVNRFYQWQCEVGVVSANPIPQRRARYSWAPRSDSPATHAPATYSHSATREQIQWLSAAEYRTWRDVGVRGFTPAGLPDDSFRGRWATRNALFCDVMVRTGLRLTELASLTVLDVPQDTGAKYQRLWLPAAVAKGGSARWVYLPRHLVRQLDEYRRFDRGESLGGGHVPASLDEDAWVVKESGRAATTLSGRTARVEQLGPRDRARLRIPGERGLEPASWWLSEAGRPIAAATWQNVFRNANRRCAQHRVALRVHPHMLRHTFAVTTLEQLQRGHIAELRQLDPANRSHYVRVFGDPVDWVRRLLGHRSITTTQIYLHALEELEMQTRMALIGDDADSDWLMGPFHADLTSS